MRFIIRQPRFKALVWLVILLICGLAIGLVTFNQKPLSSQIVDVSWPNCGHVPNTNFREGIVGANGGLDFTTNRCLAGETTWIEHYSLYMNTGYPGISYGKKFQLYPRHCNLQNKRCLGYNYGYNAAEYGLKQAANNGSYSDLWWLDVETDNSWTSSQAVNVAVLKGAVNAIEENSFLSEVGIYSTPDQWQQITGGWQNKLPEWLGTGLTSPTQAAKLCSSSSFTGGKIWLSQYTESLDINVTCSPAFNERLTSPPDSIFSAISLKNYL